MTIEESVRNLPSNPGVYLMYDKNEEIIYVGKAKNLKKRVSSYFRKNSSHTPKVIAMVENIVRFEYVIVGSEFEALVLECNLIKQHQPYYNILLKDDKTYPYIKVTTNEEYPRIMLARKVLRDKAQYFGPYLNSNIVNETIDTIKTVFNVRSCNRTLPRDIGKDRPCLNYHIGKCSAPCAGKISQLEYKNQFSKIVDFLNGNYSDVIKFMEQLMYEASKNLQFEKAAKLRDKIETIKHISDKQKITSTSLGNKDVVSVADIGMYVCIMLLNIRDGKMVNREHFTFKNPDKEPKESILTDFIKQHYSITNFIPNKIFVQYPVDDIELIQRWLSEKCGNKINLIVPQKGENLQLVKMAENNAVELLKLHILKTDINKKKMNDLIYQIKNTFGLENPPMRIESYDISNISGADSVGVCVVYENGTPKKSDYRLFNIQSVEGTDDYGSIRETLYRRLENGVEGVRGFDLPDLILIDGGKGHVKAAKEIVDFYNLDIPVFGMVKDDYHRTRGVTTENEEIHIKRTDAIFRFLTQIQDETHRFAITSFRKKHKKSTLKSELTNITGVGDVKKNKLLKAFKSINTIKCASVEELSKVVDKKTAENIYEYFNCQN